MFLPPAFPDVRADDWSAPAIRLLVEKKVLVGEPDGCFHGERAVTREEMATVCFRLLQFPAFQKDVLPSYPAEPLKDVDGKTGNWEIFDVVLRAGIMRGDPQGYFHRKSALIRRALPDILLHMLWRAKIHIPSSPTPVEYKDLDSKVWRYDVVEQVSRAGILRGYPNGYLYEQRKVTCREMAVAVARLLEYVEQESTSHKVSE